MAQESNGGEGEAVAADAAGGADGDGEEKKDEEEAAEGNAGEAPGEGNPVSVNSQDL